jgi:signal transduction histidine kinase/ligand-binding sensor domain-containing protein/DNA-binding response OmpR family regulator
MPARVLVFCLFILVLSHHCVRAQNGQYRFSHLDVNQGLSNSQVKTFLKDSRGFLWIGTISGLNRFDGSTLKIFRNDPRDTTTLLDNDIYRIFEDPSGRIWVYTYAGMCIYDPATEKFTRNVYRVLREYNMPEGFLTEILKDREGNFWFLHNTGRLYKYIPAQKKTISVLQHDTDTTLAHSNPIFSIAKGANCLWLLHRNGMLEKLDVQSLHILYRNLTFHQQNKNETPEYSLTADNDGDLWIYFVNTNNGVYHFRTSEKKIYHFNKTSSPVHLNTDIIRGVVQDNKGLIWIATDHGGVNVINKKDFSVHYILHNTEDERSLSQNSIQTMYKDYDGFIWIGTYKRGVNYYHENVIRFRLFRHSTSNKNSLPFNDINCFAEDDDGNIWIGTNGGGLIKYDRKTEHFTQYTHEPGNPNTIGSNVIVSMFFDSYKKLWIGTYYGGLNSFDGRNFTRYRHSADPKSISDDNIWEIFEDSQRQLWIGTLKSGIDVFDRDSKTFRHYPSIQFHLDSSVHSTYIPAIVEDAEKNIWIGTGYGIDFYDRKTGKFTHYLNDVNNPKSLGHNNVFSILDDGKGTIWIGTKEGLNLFDKKTKTFRALRQEDGLPHNTVLTLLQDSGGNLWMSTPQGLSNLILRRKPDGTIASFRFKNYDESDGLQGKSFNEGAAYKTRKGELIFGGANGFNLFKPEDIVLNDKKPVVRFTGLQIFNKEVKIGEKVKGSVILDKSITLTPGIRLAHSDNVFSIEFTSLNYFLPEKSRYKYKLEGFNKEWLATDGNSRRVTFTNLDPGEYTLRVKASNNDGVWNDEGTSMKIVILPPFWKTKTAFVLYIFLVMAALLVTRKLIQQRERLKFIIEQERQEAQRMHELDMMKLRFFTNVSHEFRTPLTLILAPVEKLMKAASEEQRTQFQLIHRNARRLLNLVNQLLDFRKLEVQEIKFNPSEGDIVRFIRETTFSFSDMSEKKDVSLDFKTSVDSLETIFDRDKLEKILFNLLSNAFKFTPGNGNITVTINEVHGEEGKWLEIRVTDTGIGIPLDQQEKIFERFFQHDLPGSMVNQGSGIGLSITKEFIRIHGGNITVTSEPGKGSCFTVTIPVKDVTAHEVPAALEEAEIPEWEAELQSDKPSILLIEDNEDFRFYLKDNLRLHYKIIEARNGKEGWNQALSTLPDLIVSDVMMPEMNGIELCKKIKNDPRVSHIPVILLTARTAEEQKMEGFESGADDYITKPFNFEILQSRVRNLIHQREAFQKDFRRQIEVKASDVNITSLDEKLIQRAIKCVEDNISDTAFSVETLSHELGMSRVHLYKKLLALTGKSPIEFIRVIRLQQAAQLLEKSQLTVSEVAYKVGFNNPKYFTKYFKEEYKMLPSAYAVSKRSKE